MPPPAPRDATNRHRPSCLTSAMRPPPHAHSTGSRGRGPRGDPRPEPPMRSAACRATCAPITGWSPNAPRAAPPDRSSGDRHRLTTAKPMSCSSRVARGRRPQAERLLRMAVATDRARRTGAERSETPARAFPPAPRLVEHRMSTHRRSPPSRPRRRPPPRPDHDDDPSVMSERGGRRREHARRPSGVPASDSTTRVARWPRLEGVVTVGTHDSAGTRQAGATSRRRQGHPGPNGGSVHGRMTAASSNPCCGGARPWIVKPRMHGRPPPTGPVLSADEPFRTSSRPRAGISAWSPWNIRTASAPSSRAMTPPGRSHRPPRGPPSTSRIDGG